MASSSLAPYYNATQQNTFTLVSSSVTGARWQLAGRSLSEPLYVEINRKINPSGTANDHIILKFLQTELNATTGKPATVSMSLDLSIPKDNSILDLASQKALLVMLGSLINESGAMAATQVNAAALLGGFDL